MGLVPRNLMDTSQGAGSSLKIRVINLSCLIYVNIGIHCHTRSKTDCAYVVHHSTFPIIIFVDYSRLTIVPPKLVVPSHPEFDLLTHTSTISASDTNVMPSPVANLEVVSTAILDPKPTVRMLFIIPPFLL